MKRPIVVATVVMLFVCGWSIRPAEAQPEISISVEDSGASASGALVYENQLPGESSWMQVVVANTGTGVARLSIGARDLVDGGGCAGCADSAGDPADVLMLTIESGVAGIDGVRWQGTPRELMATVAEVGLVPAGSSLTLMISETLPIRVDEASTGRLSMSLWFGMVDVNDGTSDEAKLPVVEVAGESLERSSGGSGLAFSGADVMRLSLLGVSTVVAGGVVLVRSHRRRAAALNTRRRRAATRRERL